MIGRLEGPTNNGPSLLDHAERYVRAMTNTRTHTNKKKDEDTIILPSLSHTHALFL